MTRHPIKTLRALVMMGATECSLTREEAIRLTGQWEEMFRSANYWGSQDGEELDAQVYGMDEEAT